MERANMNSYVVSLLFDKKLIDMGKWPEDIYPEIEEWNEITDYAMQKTKAAFLIRNLVLKTLGQDCSSKGKIRVKRLGNALANFEQIIISTRGLERKFYRDHLNHLIRVALLARAIGQKSPFNLPYQDSDKLVLASLFHDVAYPLSNIGQGVRFSVRAIKDCYNIASGASLIPEIKFKLELEKFSSLLPKLLCEYKTRLKELDHGTLSSLEFISYLEQSEKLFEKYMEVIKAIAFHHPPNIERINSMQEKILSILILADELQDWGRPVGHLTYISFMPKIEKFKLDDYVLQGEYYAKNIPGFSTLRQVHGKTPNLKRIQLPKDFDFNLKFFPGDFNELDLQKVQRTLQVLFNKCRELEGSLFHPPHFKKLYENNSVFEKEYYGRPIPKKAKLKLYELLKDKELSLRSPFENLRLFFDDVIKELLITSGSISTAKHFQFRSSSSGFIKLELVSESNDIFQGEIKSIHDPEVLDLVMSLLSEIRFFNICVQKIAKFQATKYPIKIGFEGFPRNGDLTRVSKETQETEINLRHCSELLRKLRDCIFNEGIFFFKTSERT
jgi:hypothetical protein